MSSGPTLKCNLNTAAPYHNKFFVLENTKYSHNCSNTNSSKILKTRKINKYKVQGIVLGNKYCGIGAIRQSTYTK